MIKKVIKPDNYNVAYFGQDYTLTISKSLELSYYQEEEFALEFSKDLVYNYNQLTNFELETIISELDISSVSTLTSYLREARKVIKEISVLAKQIELLTTANQITISTTAKQILVSTSAFAG